MQIHIGGAGILVKVKLSTRLARIRILHAGRAGSVTPSSPYLLRPDGLR